MIVIKNMDMPENCYECRFELRGWCIACEGNLPRVRSLDRPEWCPLTSIDDNALKLAQILKDAGLTSEYVKDLVEDLEGLRRGFVHRLAEKAKEAIDAGILYGAHSNPEDTFRGDFGGGR